MLKDKRILVCTISIILLTVIAVVTFVIAISINNKQETNNKEETIDKESLKTQFNQPFLNNETQYVKTLYNIVDSKAKYEINAYIPQIEGTSEDVGLINKEIIKLFVDDVLNNIVSVDQYSTYEIEYTSYINNNILSLVIRAKIKKGANPKRIIIKTYNYDIQQNKKIELSDVISEEQAKELQTEINHVIEEENKKAEKIIEQGYNAYIRDTESTIYNIENATEFFIGNDNILYIVYAYGNQNYTDAMDLIIEKIK